MVPEAATRAHGPLRPIELATAAVMAGVAVVLTVAGWFLPHLSIVAASRWSHSVWWRTATVYEPSWRRLSRRRCSAF